MKKKGLTELLISIVTAELTGVLSALLSGNMTDYGTLIKPPLSPPAAVFSVVWPILYALMGISVYLVQTSDARAGEISDSVKIYTAQLVMNFLWSIIYFRFGMLTAAAALIGALIVTVFIMILRFRKIHPAAAWLNVPYLLWLIFALYLNIGTVLLN